MLEYQEHLKITDIVFAPYIAAQLEKCIDLIFGRKPTDKHRSFNETEEGKGARKRVVPSTLMPSVCQNRTRCLTLSVFQSFTECYTLHSVAMERKLPLTLKSFLEVNDVFSEPLRMPSEVNEGIKLLLKRFTVFMYFRTRDIMELNDVRK